MDESKSPPTGKRSAYRPGRRGRLTVRELLMQPFWRHSPEARDLLPPLRLEDAQARNESLRLICSEVGPPDWEDATVDSLMDGILLWPGETPREHGLDANSLRIHKRRAVGALREVRLLDPHRVRKVELSTFDPDGAGLLTGQQWVSALEYLADREVSVIAKVFQSVPRQLRRVDARRWMLLQVGDEVLRQIEGEIEDRTELGWFRRAHTLVRSRFPARIGSDPRQLTRSSPFAKTLYGRDLLASIEEALEAHLLHPTDAASQDDAVTAVMFHSYGGQWMDEPISGAVLADALRAFEANADFTPSTSKVYARKFVLAVQRLASERSWQLHEVFTQNDHILDSHMTPEGELALSPLGLLRIARYSSPEPLTSVEDGQTWRLAARDAIRDIWTVRSDQESGQLLMDDRTIGEFADLPGSPEGKRLVGWLWAENRIWAEHSRLMTEASADLWGHSIAHSEPMVSAERIQRCLVAPTGETILEDLAEYFEANWIDTHRLHLLTNDVIRVLGPPTGPGLYVPLTEPLLRRAHATFQIVVGPESHKTLRGFRAAVRISRGVSWLGTPDPFTRPEQQLFVPNSTTELGGFRAAALAGLGAFQSPIKGPSDVMTAWKLQVAESVRTCVAAVIADTRAREIRVRARERVGGNRWGAWQVDLPLVRDVALSGAPVADQRVFGWAVSRGFELGREIDALDRAVIEERARRGLPDPQLEERPSPGRVRDAEPIKPSFGAVLPGERRGRPPVTDSARESIESRGLRRVDPGFESR